MRRLWIFFLFPVALAQTAQEPRGLLPLLTHPVRLQALAQLEAARAQRSAQASPLALQAQGGHGLLGYECQSQALCDALPKTASSLTLSLALTPFAFGDTQDALRRAELTVRRAELGYARAVLALLAQAYGAQGRLEEALLGLRLAEAGLALAQEGLLVAQRRLEGGGASSREVREAEARLREAQEAKVKAEEGVFLARLSAQSLVLPDQPLPPLAPPEGGVPLRVQEAELALEEARVLYESTFRALLPTLQAQVLLYPSEKDQLALGLTSRTLQPTLSYTYQDPGRTSAIPGARVSREVRLGLALTLSPGLLEGLKAAENQVKGAEEALRAARLQAQVEEEALRQALAQKERGLELAKKEVSDKAKALEETQARARLGLESPLKVREAEVALLQAELKRKQAENALLGAILDLYSFYGRVPFKALEAGGKR
jgi:outer membrane protein TolC